MSVNKYLQKIEQKNAQIHVSINKVPFEGCTGWYYDEAAGEIRNSNRTFFQVTGIKSTVSGHEVHQPIILQHEIGYIGIIRKLIDGEMRYLMQYKIEPGNVNQIQISPTLQATKSNFTQQHGGAKPAYLEYFLNAKKYRIIVDQVQSEQSSRFLAKRNRNIIIELSPDEEIEVLPNFDWMTLRELKQLMRYDNLVNMDTRTGLSCLPFSVCRHSPDELTEIEKGFSDKALFNSVYKGDGSNILPEIFQYINDYKMFSVGSRELIPLFSLSGWSMQNGEFVCSEPYSFKAVFCDIEIEGREVKHWCQPLFEATGAALFGLFTCVDNGVRKFLVKAKPEIGCLDGIELGPSVQREFVSSEERDGVDELFDKKLREKHGVIFDTLLSEEGGRFYHEQNRNVMIEIEKNELELPEGCFWSDYKTLNTLVQVNNVLNIQLRNLLSVLEL